MNHFIHSKKRHSKTKERVHFWGRMKDEAVKAKTLTFASRFSLLHPLKIC